MQVIKAGKITEAVAKLCLKANCTLRADVLRKLKAAYLREKKKGAREALGLIIKNARIADKEMLPICQDTGFPVVFVELGQQVRVDGDLRQAIIKGVELGYKRGSFRESIIKDPLKRGRSSYAGAIIHTDIVSGNKIKITVLPKGFGCENKSRLKMFDPTVSLDEIKKFIVNAVKSIGADACPPYVVGVGIGGAADYASLLAKKALLSDLYYIPTSKLSRELLAEINNLHIGPMGLGGEATCLAVNIQTYPTHIAGLPVAVNISCHALRSASIII